MGTLEAFNTDGLRTLLRTIPAASLREKTLRYPGHAEKMRVLRDAGFLDARPIRVGDVDIAPRALTEALLFPAWKLPPGEEEFTLLRVRVRGVRENRPVEVTWTLLDRTDSATGSTSMARTTGFPCAIVARFLAFGSFRVPGVHPAEFLGRDGGLTDRMLTELASRGVNVRREG